MIYFYSTIHIHRGGGFPTIIRSTLYLQIKGKLDSATTHKIRTHIQHVWEPEGANPYVQYSNRRGDKRQVRTLHPQYQEIAKRIEHRFASTRGKIVGYRQVKHVFHYEWVVTNDASLGYQKLLLTRKKFKFDLWYIRCPKLRSV